MLLTSDKEKRGDLPKETSLKWKLDLPVMTGHNGRKVGRVLLC